MKIVFPQRNASLSLATYLFLLLLPPMLSLSLFYDYLAARVSVSNLSQQIERRKVSLPGRGSTALEIPPGPSVFEAETVTISASEMQKRVMQILATYGAIVLASQAITTPEESLVRLQVSIDMNVRESELPKLLYALEVERPFLFINTLGIQGRENSDGDTTLRVTFRVDGFSRVVS